MSSALGFILCALGGIIALISGHLLSELGPFSLKSEGDTKWGPSQIGPIALLCGFIAGSALYVVGALILLNSGVIVAPLVVV